MAKPVGPYSSFVRAGSWVFTSGQVGIVDGKLVEGGFDAQLAQVLTNLRGVLADAGVTPDQVAKCTVFLTDMADFAALNERYSAFFGAHRPARSAVAVAALPLGAVVEIEAVAFTGDQP